MIKPGGGKIDKEEAGWLEGQKKKKRKKKGTLSRILAIQLQLRLMKYTDNFRAGARTRTTSDLRACDVTWQCTYSYAFISMSREVEREEEKKTGNCPRSSLPRDETEIVYGAEEDQGHTWAGSGTAHHLIAGPGPGMILVRKHPLAAAQVTRTSAYHPPPPIPVCPCFCGEMSRLHACLSLNELLLWTELQELGSTSTTPPIGTIGR